MEAQPDRTTRRNASPRSFRLAEATEPVPAQVRRWVVQDILCGAPEAEIEHDGAVYRLRLTAQGKLILTK
jgi:hemin uptake protein HemP